MAGCEKSPAPATQRRVLGASHLDPSGAVRVPAFADEPPAESYHGASFRLVGVPGGLVVELANEVMRRGLDR
jgi:hypothetical protein